MQGERTTSNRPPRPASSASGASAARLTTASISAGAGLPRLREPRTRQGVGDAGQVNRGVKVEGGMTFHPLPPDGLIDCRGVEIDQVNFVGTARPAGAGPGRCSCPRQHAQPAGGVGAVRQQQLLDPGTVGGEVFPVRCASNG